MNLRLVREPSKDGATLGVLFVNGTFESFVLEDEIREVKIPGETAIPAGRYRVRVTPSPRFGRRLPELLDVPGFTGIRIHAGNTKADTEGCLLPGRTRGPATVGESKMAFEHLYQLIRQAELSEDVWVDIENPR